MKIRVILNYRSFLSKSFSIISILSLYSNKQSCYYVTMKILVIFNYRNLLSESFLIILILSLYSNGEFNYSQLSQPLIEVVFDYFNFVVI